MFVIAWSPKGHAHFILNNGEVMVLAGLGPTGIVLIALIALLLFGSRKLPELGRSVGRTLNEFKKGAVSDADDYDAKLK